MSQFPFTRLHEVECRRVIFDHSQSFYLSSLLLPPDVRMCAWAVYGFCRTADDAVDEAGVDVELKKRVDLLRTRLSRIYSGKVDSVLDDAFAQFVQHYNVPKSIPSSLIDGFEIDASGIDFETETELIQYSFHVASTVGLMLSYAMGARSYDALMKASSLGIAMQLTNIARDMGADFRNGRFYVPKCWRKELGYDQSETDSSTASQSTKELAKKLIALANSFYVSASQGINLLPTRCRVAITASMYVYGAINDAIKENSFDTISKRAYVSIPQKVLLVGKATSAVILNSNNSNVSEGPFDSLIESNLVQLNLVGNSFRELEATAAEGA